MNSKDACVGLHACVLVYTYGSVLVRACVCICAPVCVCGGGGVVSVWVLMIDLKVRYKLYEITVF